MNNSKISRKEACEILSISTETAKKWIKLNKLKMNDDKTFDKEYIENLAVEIKNNNHLKSRRNKKLKDNIELYNGYINSYKNREAVKELVMRYENKQLSDNELRLILVHFAKQLFNKTNNSNSQTFEVLISDFLKNSAFENINIENIILDFVPYEDTLGFIYLSLSALNNRKKNGMYFTPSRITNRIINNLSDSVNLKEKSICDICCGSGNFLLALSRKGIFFNNIYGIDIDDICVSIARINMFLNNPSLTTEQLYSHLICNDVLVNHNNKFDIIIGNPPWGFEYNKEYIKELKKTYTVAKNKGFESYDLFIGKGINLLNDNGYLAYVLPESVMNVKSHLTVRNLILNNMSFKFVDYFGKTLKVANCSVISLCLQKCNSSKTKDCRIITNNSTFAITESRSITPECFNLNIKDYEYNILEKINNIKKPVYLKNNAIFAVGIITGDNKKYIIGEHLPDTQPIVKGTDIDKYVINEPNNFIYFDKVSFQQTAPLEVYRSDEKLIYKYISDKPVFAYDNKRMLPLNSCNVLIPKLDSLDIKYILAILNSSVAEFYFKKKFNSIKMLKSHIESLPIPVPATKTQSEIVNLVDEIISNPNKTLCIQNKLNGIISDLYGVKL